MCKGATHAGCPALPTPELKAAPAMLLAEHTAADDAHFPGSHIIGNNASWGTTVNTWAKKPATQTWSLCFSSITQPRHPSHVPQAVRLAQYHGGVRAKFNRQRLRRLRAWLFLSFCALLPLFSVDARAPEMPEHLTTWLRLL
jgi:hypothetical protein